MGVHVGKRNLTEPTLPARSSVQDVYGSGVQLILADNGYSNNDPPPRLKRHASNSRLDNTMLKMSQHSSGNDKTDGEIMKLASFANLSLQSSEKGINFTYTEQEREEALAKSNLANKKHGQSNGNGLAEKKTTFATLPNTTTWQQQSNQQNQQSEHQPVGKVFIVFIRNLLFIIHIFIKIKIDFTDEISNNTVMASQLNNIRLKLEEKRRHIESEKRRMEIVMSKQRQKVGKAAFLQAVTKVGLNSINFLV